MGAIDLESQSTSGKPRISSSCSSGGNAKRASAPSSARWSGGRRPRRRRGTRRPRPGRRQAELGAARAHRAAAVSARLRRRRRPSRLGEPASRALRVVAGGGTTSCIQREQLRLVHDPGLDPLQVLVEPAHALLQEPDRRARLAIVRENVAPRADQALAKGPGRPSSRRGTALRVAVRPAADGVDRRLDRGVVLAHRSVPPVRVAALVGEPGLDHRLRAVQSVEPYGAPAVADRRGVGRLAHSVSIVAAHWTMSTPSTQPPRVVDVVGVAVVAEHIVTTAFSARGRRAATWRPLNPPHQMPNIPTSPAAPRLGGEPRDHLQRVLLFLRQVLVVEQAVRVAAPAQVDPYAGVAVLGEVRRGGGCRAPRRRRPCDTGGTRGSPGLAPASGSHSRAASRVPSDSGIHVWSTRRIGGPYGSWIGSPDEHAPPRAQRPRPGRACGRRRARCRSPWRARRYSDRLDPVRTPHYPRV